MTFGCRTIISMFYNLMSITRLVTFSQRTAIFFALLLIFLFKLLTHSKNVIEVYPALALTLQFRPRELGSNLFPKYLCLMTSPITFTNLLYSNAALLQTGCIQTQHYCKSYLAFFFRLTFPVTNVM